MTFADGVATFVLKHGESKTATNLPAGITYTVSEAEADKDGYTTTCANASGSIVEDATVTAAFTNTKDSSGAVEAAAAIQPSTRCTTSPTAAQLTRMNAIPPARL